MMKFSEAKKLRKAALESLMADSVIRRSPALYAGFEEDALIFVRNNYTTKSDLLRGGACVALWAFEWCER
jgi:hypothetical protein